MSASRPCLLRALWISALAMVGYVSTFGCEAPQQTQTPAIDPAQTPNAANQPAHQYKPRHNNAIELTIEHNDAYVLADFERPLHAAGFSSNAPTPPHINPVGPAGANSNALTVTLPPQTALTLDLDNDDLPRPTDWRNISTLSFQLFGLATGGPVRAAIITGPEPHLDWSQTFILNPGWNTCVINLATAAERIDLADVRRVSWQWLGAETAELSLDQLALREYLRLPHLEGQTVEPDSLIYLQRGSQLHVGVVSSFELVFDRGLIVGWYDRKRLIGSEPRITQPGSIDDGPLPPFKSQPPAINLSPFVGIGPHPVPLSKDWPSAEEQPPSFDSPRCFDAWGRSLMTRQQVVEASPDRISIEATWRFAASPSSRASGGEHQWRYTIYSSGDVFVDLRSDGPSWPGDQVGYAVSLTGRVGFNPVGIGQQEHRPRAVLFERPLGTSDLLWTPYDAADGTLLQKLSSTRDRWLAAVTTSQANQLPIETTHWLHFGSCDRKMALSWAAAYQTPSTLELTAGELVRTAQGDLDHDGFNESTGVYELRPQAGRLRLTLHEKAPPFGLHLRLHGGVHSSIQAYQDGRRVEHWLYDQDELVVLTLNPRFEPPSTVEIFLSEGE